MQKDIIYVTAFKDIRREQWNSFTRTNEEYIDLFLNLARNITSDQRLIVYCDPDIRDKVTDSAPSHIEYRSWDEVESFYKRYIEVEKRVIASTEYKSKLAPHRLQHPEHIYAEYNLVNHSKVNFIRHTKNIYPDYTFYTWLDFGLCRNPDDCPINVCIPLIPKDKITYLAIKDPRSAKMDPVEMLQTDDIYLTGSLFIVHTGKVEAFEEAFKNKICEYHRLCLSDDDQSLVTQIYWDQPDWFNIVLDAEWFSLFRKHYNMRTKKDFHRLLNDNNLQLTGKYVEIGVARGVFSEYLCKNTTFEKLYLVDPYKNFTLEEYTDAMNSYDMEYEFNYTINRLKPFSDKITFIRETSTDALSMFDDESLDFVYVDGNHAYKYVLEDLENYWKKVKKGGILAGDDFYDNHSNTKDAMIYWDNVQSIHHSGCFGKFGVCSAVKDFCEQNRVQYYRFDNQYYIVKG